MIITDQHMHCQHSHDSNVAPEKMILGSIQKGLKYIAFTDHYDLDMQFVKNPKSPLIPLDYENHIKEISALKEKYKEQIYVAVGLEVGYCPQSSDLYLHINKDNRLDAIINSIHLVQGQDCYYKDYFKFFKTKHNSYLQYFKAVLESLNASFDYDIVGHLGYVARKAPYKNALFSYDDFKEVLDDILITVIEKDKTIEINTHAHLYNLQFLPTMEILKRYKDLGGQNITYSSDAHYVARIAEKRDMAFEILTSLGYKHLVVYKNRKKHEVPLL